MTTMTRKFQKDLEERLRDAGIEVLGFEKIGKHYKIHIEKDGVKCFSPVGTSISDWRAVMNVVMYAKRNLAAAKEGAR